jgi:RimJ/RimL family protein N-acetyltransferase
LNPILLNALLMSNLDHLSVDIPILETDRLRLRRHRVDDFAACTAMWADPAVTRFLGVNPFKAEEVWDRLLRYVGHWALLGFGFWAVEEKETGAFVGDLGFMDFKRDMQPSLKDVPEIGWILASRAHGKGYATEAVRAAVTWGTAHFKSQRTACIIDPDNLRSIRVAEKCGYQKELLTTYKSHPVILFLR